jgi:Putative endonuclease segE, GIY-YIG domain
MLERRNYWLFEQKEFNETDIPEGVIGFIYEIENLTNGMKYIGKKNFYSHKYSVRTVVVKTGPNKGTKKKKKTKIPIASDWKTYYGSSEWLKTVISETGVENFERRILKLCRSKSELSYYEIKEQIVRDVLLRDDYYNSWISCKIHRQHMKMTTEEDLD